MKWGFFYFSKKKICLILFDMSHIELKSIKSSLTSSYLKMKIVSWLLVMSGKSANGIRKIGFQKFLKV